MSNQNPADFLSFCRNFDQAMLVTHDGQNGLAARPMMIAEIDHVGNFWFSTDVASGKVDEIKNDHHVCITMSGMIGHATVHGTASIIRDLGKIKDLWDETWRVWFPGGPDDPTLVLIKVDALRGEYWATSGIKGWKYLFTMAKSYVAGNRPQEDSSVHGVVKL